MNDDIEKSFEGVSPNTFNNYKSYYNRLLKLLGTDTVIQNSNSFIIDTLNDHEILPNSIKTFITIIIRIKTLPSYDEIKSYMNNLLNENKFRDYIINYLLINYGVRNLDIDVLITTDKSVTLKRYIAKENYLYVTPRYIIYQRNNYKTSSVYGRKSYKIVNLSFRNSVNFMLGNKKECRLLFGCEDNTYNEKQIGNIVLNSTFNKIGESSYFKILIKHYQLENNIDMIRFLSQSRGTDLNTIFKYYNINE